MEQYNYNTANSLSEYVSEYLDLEQMENVRFEAVSATNSILLMEYSDDKISVKIPIEIRLCADKYVSYPVDRKMRYVRYHFRAIEDGKAFKITFSGKILPPPPVSSGWFW